MVFKRFGNYLLCDSGDILFVFRGYDYRNSLFFNKFLSRTIFRFAIAIEHCFQFIFDSSTVIEYELVF